MVGHGGSSAGSYLHACSTLNSVYLRLYGTYCIHTAIRYRKKDQLAAAYHDMFAQHNKTVHTANRGKIIASNFIRDEEKRKTKVTC